MATALLQPDAQQSSGFSEEFALLKGNCIAGYFLVVKNVFTNV